MNHAPKIDAKNALPVLQWVEHLAARLNACVVHQDIGAAEPLSHGLFQYRDVFDPADVGGHGHDVGGAAWCCRCDPRFGFGETVGAQIRDTNFHSKTSMAAARPIPDAPPVITATLFGDMAACGT